VHCIIKHQTGFKVCNPSMHPMMPQDLCFSVVTSVLSAPWQALHRHAAAIHRALNAISWRHGIRSCTPTPHQKTSRCVRPTLPSWRVVTLGPTQGFYGRTEASAELTWLTNGIARFQVCKTRLCKPPTGVMAFGSTATPSQRGQWQVWH